MKTVAEKVAEFVPYLKSGNSVPVCVDSFIRQHHDVVKAFLISLRDEYVIHEFTAEEIEIQRLCKLKENDRYLADGLEFLEKNPPNKWFTEEKHAASKRAKWESHQRGIISANVTYRQPFIVEHPEGWIPLAARADGWYPDATGRFLLKYRGHEDSDNMDTGTGPFDTLAEARKWYLTGGR